MDKKKEVKLNDAQTQNVSGGYLVNHPWKCATCKTINYAPCKPKKCANCGGTKFE